MCVLNTKRRYHAEGLPAVLAKRIVMPQGHAAGATLLHYFVGIIYPREQNFHPARCSMILNQLNTKWWYKIVLRDSAHQSKNPMRRFHWLEIDGLTFCFNFEMESDFSLFQWIFVCFVIRSVLYPISGLSRRFNNGYGSCQYMLKSGNKSGKHLGTELENDSNHNINNQSKR